MAKSVWYNEGYIAFDTETTGVNEQEDHILTACIIYYSSDHKELERKSWLINPGVEVPEEASSINGLTTEHVQEHGMNALEGIHEILLELSYNPTSPIVAYNGSYDITILYHNAKRLGLKPTKAFRAVFGEGFALHLIDGLTMHRKAYKKWRGRRNLSTLCEHYGIDLTDAHTAEADTDAAAKLTVAITNENPNLFGGDEETLAAAQAVWYAEQMEDLQAYLRKARNDDTIICNPEWPIRH